MEPLAPYRTPVVTEVKPDSEGRKSRIFRAELVCFVTANRLWELGATAKEGILRPVLLAYAATEQEARAFTANLRTGRPIVEDTRSSSKLRFELPRSAGFQLETHSRDGGTLTLAYLRPAFALQPSIAESDRVEFLCMPPAWWVAREAVTLTAFGEDAADVARAAYFVAYLDARSPLPIANDHRFHLELYRAARAAHWTRRPTRADRASAGFAAEGCAALGFEPPLLVSASQQEFSAFLAEQTAKHLGQPPQEAPDHGKTRIRRARRLLSNAARRASQPRLAP
ncbi:MAG TPA: hypothetical protein VHB47_09475 [Thermoanaerobaculia bacterium]|jgi:hypothetical protein|nr:hypothetical protein [Thermoanaerobaculia bacterium]